MPTLTTSRALGVVLGAALMNAVLSPVVHADSAVLKATQSATFGPSIPVDSPTFCWGLNNLDQCVLYYGSANSCNNIAPCNNRASSTAEIKSAIAEVAIGQKDLTFCYGKDDVTGQCTLFLGSREQCNHVEPCSVGFKQLEAGSKPLR